MTGPSFTSDTAMRAPKTAVWTATPAARSALPGYSRPLIRVGDYLALLERSTYDGERVR